MHFVQSRPVLYISLSIISIFSFTEEGIFCLRGSWSANNSLHAPLTLTQTFMICSNPRALSFLTCFALCTLFLGGVFMLVSAVDMQPIYRQSFNRAGILVSILGFVLLISLRKCFPLFHANPSDPSARESEETPGTQ